MRGIKLCTLAITSLVGIVVFPFGVSQAQATVVINEIAWMGTTVSANAEWIELFNNGSTVVDLTGWRLTTANGSPLITLTGSILVGGYFLLERTSDDSVLGVTANQIYTGALTNSGTTLTLTNTSGSTIDQVDGGVNWGNIGGDNASKETAQRTDSGWRTAVSTPGAINVGVSNTSSGAVDSSATTTAPVVTTQSVVQGGSVEYLPIPTLRIIAGTDRVVSSDADTTFTAVVYDSKGNKRDDATVAWSFGDGMRRVGAKVFHTYYEPGEYVAIVHATTSDGGDSMYKIIVTVKDASIEIVSVSSKGITIANSSSRVIDLSFWRLSMGGQEFKIPANTQILAGRTILFPSQIIELPVTETASLLYPSGEVVMIFPSVSEQPFVSKESSRREKVELPVDAGTPVPVVSVKTVQKKGDATIATAAIVASLVGDTEEVVVPPQLDSVPVKSKGLFSSPWTYSLFGVIALAGSAFIFL